MLCRTGLSIAIFGHSDDFFKVTHLHEESRTVLKRLHYRYASSRRVKLPENKKSPSFNTAPFSGTEEGDLNKVEPFIFHGNKRNTSSDGRMERERGVKKLSRLASVRVFLFYLTRWPINEDGRPTEREISVRRVVKCQPHHRFVLVSSCSAVAFTALDKLDLLRYDWKIKKTLFQKRLNELKIYNALGTK